MEQVIYTLSEPEYRRYFEERDFGNGLNEIVVIFMCHDSALNLKRRVRLTKKDKTLYMDIMLDLPEMKAADANARKRIVAERLLKEVPEVVSKYKIVDFDSARFIHDFKSWIAKTGWLSQPL